MFGLGFNYYLENSFRYVYFAGLLTFGLGIAFLYAREKKKYLYYFSYFLIFAVAANTSDILYFYLNINILILLNAIFYNLEGIYLLKAIHKYFKINLNKRWFNFFKISISISILAFLFGNQLFILAPAVTFLSFSFLKSGKLLFDSSFNEIVTFAAIITMLLGVNLLITPYFLMNSHLNKYLVFCRGFFGLLFGISIFAVYYEELQYQLKIREEQYQKLFDQSPAGMMLIDKNNEIIKVNKSICQLTGYSKNELEGSSIFENLIPIKYKIKIQKTIKEIFNGQDKEYIIKTYDKSDNQKYFLVRETKFIQPDYSRCVLSMRIDYTNYKEQQQKIKYLSYHDNLTDLYNRTFIEEEMKRLNNSRQLPISIMMIDVNGLKLFNDIYGHQKGDQLLIKTAEILKKSTRSEDFVARWAGDEFVILLPMTNKKDAKIIVDRIKAECNQTKNNKIIISLAIGTAVKEKKEKDIFDVFKKADEKMYNQKMSRGRKEKKEIMKKILNDFKDNSGVSRKYLQRIKKTALDFAKNNDLN